MSFNLNKNSGPANSSKFDLSKNNGEDTEQKAKKSSYWVWVLPALMVIGGGIWYASSGSGSDTIKPADSTATSPVPAEKSRLAADSQKVPKKDSTGAAIAKSVTDSVAISPVKTSATLSGAKTVAASFKTGSATLTGISKNVVKDLLSLSSGKKNEAIRVNGYASSEGPLAVNQKISQSRADAFKEYLVSKGIAGNKIIATGKGIDNPIASNDTEEGRRKNRRVEVIIE